MPTQNLMATAKSYWNIALNGEWLLVLYGISTISFSKEISCNTNTASHYNNARKITIIWYCKKKMTSVVFARYLTTVYTSRNVLTITN